MLLTPSLEVILIIFLVAAVISDFSDHRIPNAITLFAAATGLLGHIYLDAFQGASFALAGFALGLVFLLPFYLVGGMGAGDVKMMGAIGSFVGPQATLLAVGVALVCGGLMAIGLVLFSLLRPRRAPGGGAGSNARNGSVMAAGLEFHTTEVGQTLKARFPYALAIAVGGLASLVYLRF